MSSQYNEAETPDSESDTERQTDDDRGSQCGSDSGDRSDNVEADIAIDDTDDMDTYVDMYLEPRQSGEDTDDHHPWHRRRTDSKAVPIPEETTLSFSSLLKRVLGKRFTEAKQPKWFDWGNRTNGGHTGFGAWRLQWEATVCPHSGLNHDGLQRVCVIVDKAIHNTLRISTCCWMAQCRERKNGIVAEWTLPRGGKISCTRHQGIDEKTDEKNKLSHTERWEGKDVELVLSVQEGLFAEKKLQPLAFPDHPLAEFTSSNYFGMKYDAFEAEHPKPIQFNQDLSTVVLKSGTGTGKTTEACKAVLEEVQRGGKVIILTARQSLARTIQQAISSAAGELGKEDKTANSAIPDNPFRTFLPERSRTPKKSRRPQKSRKKYWFRCQKGRPTQSVRHTRSPTRTQKSSSDEKHVDSKSTNQHPLADRMKPGGAAPEQPELSDASRNVVMNYLDMLGSPTAIQSTQSLIISVDSAHLLFQNDGSLPAPDLLWIDEHSSVLKYLTHSTTLNRKRAHTWTTVTQLVRSAANLLVTDADIGDTDLNFLKSLRDPKKTVVFHNLKKTNTKSYAITEGDDMLLSSHVLQDLEAGLNLFIACDSRTRATEIHALLESRQIRSLLYDSKSTSAEKADIGRCNQVWQTVQAVITSPVITYGVDFNPDTPYFHRVYGFFTGSSFDYGSAFQQLERVRKIAPRPGGDGDDVIICFRQLRRPQRTKTRDDVFRDMTYTNRSLRRDVLREHDKFIARARAEGLLALTEQYTMIRQQFDSNRKLTVDRTDPFVIAYAQTVLDDSRSKSDFPGWLCARISESGGQIRTFSPRALFEGRKQFQTEIVAIASEREKATENAEDKWCQSIAHAKSISSSEAASLKATKRLSSNEQAQLTKHAIAQTYGFSSVETQIAKLTPSFVKEYGTDDVRRRYDHLFQFATSPIWRATDSLRNHKEPLWWMTTQGGKESTIVMAHKAAAPSTLLQLVASLGIEFGVDRTFANDTLDASVLGQLNQIPWEYIFGPTGRLRAKDKTKTIFWARFFARLCNAYFPKGICKLQNRRKRKPARGTADTKTSTSSVDEMDVDSGETAIPTSRSTSNLVYEATLTWNLAPPLTLLCGRFAIHHDVPRAEWALPFVSPSTADPIEQMRAENIKIGEKRKRVVTEKSVVNPVLSQPTGNMRVENIERCGKRRRISTEKSVIDEKYERNDVAAPLSPLQPPSMSESASVASSFTTNIPLPPNPSTQSTTARSTSLTFSRADTAKQERKTENPYRLEDGGGLGNWGQFSSQEERQRTTALLTNRFGSDFVAFLRIHAAACAAAKAKADADSDQMMID